MNKTLLERQPNNKRIATTESLQKRFFNGSKNHVMEIEKLICHHSATKEHINFGYTILFLNYFYFSCHKAERMPRSSIYFFRNPAATERNRNRKAISDSRYTSGIRSEVY